MAIYFVCLYALQILFSINKFKISNYLNLKFQLLNLKIYKSMLILFMILNMYILL